jgi:hypothetical protein
MRVKVASVATKTQNLPVMFLSVIEEDFIFL